jgi:cytochrome o ubiquinol oxidase subunit 2
VPQLAGQIYTMAGMATHLNLQADYPGVYRGMSANFSGDGFADMHFNVDAVSPDTFAHWLDTARSAGPALDAGAYDDLVKPSKAVAPFTYRSVDSALFARVVSAVSQSDESVCLGSPKTVRLER